MNHVVEAILLTFWEERKMVRIVQGIKNSE